MNIAVTSQNFRTITGHAGKTRRFLVFTGTTEGEWLETDRLDLPKDMIWHGEPQKLDDKYQQMKPEEVARGLLQACADENWEELLKYWPIPQVDQRFKDSFGGVLEECSTFISLPLYLLQKIMK